MKPANILYLASPYSDPDPSIQKMRYSFACAAAAMLMKQGHIVYSPIAHNHYIAEIGCLNGDWPAWEKQCLAMLDVCTLMIVLKLPGWKDSVGIRAETAYCAKIRKPVIYTYLDGLRAFDFNRLPRFEEADEPC